MTWPQLRKVSIWQTAAAMQSELEAQGVKASDGDDEAEVHVVTGKPITRDPLEAARMGGEDAKSVRKTAIVTPSYAEPASQAKEEAPARSPAKEEDDEDEDKENQNDEESKAARDRRIDELLRAQPKKKSLGGLSSLGSKVNAPHRIKANDQITEKLAKMRKDLSAQGLGGDAPWDEFGRPRVQAFKK